METNMTKQKVALMFICTNPQYWPFAREIIQDAKKNFLPGHDVDFLLWSDMPEEVNYGATLFEVGAAPWPLPTLMRFHLFLQEEETLRKYDYLFYCDIDMRMVGTIGGEILGEGLTAAYHPMYKVCDAYKGKPGCIPPFEPNPESKSYVPQPYPENYYAGGFQGGKTETFITAMREMKKNIDIDFARNYIPIWNDESAWNRYLIDNPPSVILNQAYVYPDSLIKEYYEKIWGESFEPKLITLTKKFTTSKENGDAIKKRLQEMQ